MVYAVNCDKISNSNMVGKCFKYLYSLALSMKEKNNDHNFASSYPLTFTGI